MRFWILIGFVLADSFAAPAQQGSADAIVVKIPGANIPSTVILSTPGGSGLPGRQISIPITLSLNGATPPASFQLDLGFDSTLLTFVSASGLSASVVSAGDVRLSVGGAGQAALTSGVTGYATFAISESFGAGPTPMNLVGCVSADPAGNPLSTGCLAGTIGRLTCAVTGDGNTSVVDVQAMINQALGIAGPLNDLNGDGMVNVIDVQVVIAAAMGRSCIY